MFRPTTPQTRYGSLVLTTLAVVVTADPAAGQGTAIIRVESRMSHPDVRFSFFGDVEGTVSPGESLEASVGSGRHSSSQPAPSPWLTLVDVACDDQQSATPSTGSVVMRAANFHIDGGETVICTFVYDGFEEFIIPDDLPAGAGEVVHPKPGVWGVNNLTGSMQCPGLISRDLSESRDDNHGELKVLGDGERLFADAFDDDREDVMVYRVPEIPGRYTGWVQDTYEGYTVMVHLVYQLITDEWIVGYMTGDMSVENVFCRLYRPFEIHYEEPPRNQD